MKAALTPSSRVAFPVGRHFAVTWGIADTHGGMTSALLHRTRAFVQLGGIHVDVLTFDTGPDYPALAELLRRQGELVDGMGLLNLWDWLRDNPSPEASASGLDLHAFVPLVGSSYRAATERSGCVLSRNRYASDGRTVLQTDHYRLDGSLLVSDRRDVDVPGTRGGRSVVLCDPTGTPVRSWTSIWSLYRFWLDQVSGRSQSYFIVDSKTAANFMTSYRRPFAVTMHVVHSSHLATAERPFAPLKPTRKHVFENLNGFDAVVLLTRRQHRDVVALLGPQTNLTVIPNGRTQDLIDPLDQGYRHQRGIVLASLTTRKRVDHAIRATVAATRDEFRGVSAPKVTLDVFGDGPQHDTLRMLVTDLAAEDVVHLHGHDSAARKRLSQSSFVLLTGTSEGFPLVLVEAMAAGCIPISYDIPYGPADVIAHGRNGFLVPNGDIARMAETIVELQHLRPRHIARMRRAAARTAHRYSDDVITRLWAKELSAAARRKHGSPSARAGVKGVLRRGKKAIRSVVTTGRLPQRR